MSEDREIMQRVRAGDESALACLYAKYGDKFKAIALWDTREAEDVVQELFVEIWNKADRYDPKKSSPVTWMRLLLKGRLIDHIRSRQAYTNRNARYARESETYYTGTQREIERNSVRELIQRALGTLPKAQKACVEMAYLQEMSRSEISKLTNLPRATVQVRVQQGVKKVKAFLLGSKDNLMNYENTNTSYGIDLCEAYVSRHPTFRRVSTKHTDTDQPSA